MMADFTDCELDGIRVGLPVRMAFKRKAVDKERGFVNYFWKAVPVSGATASAAAGLDFKDRVAVITGAGAGLGRTYALELARRGAKVVVNDLGGARDGSGHGSSAPADKVVEEIQALGGEAVANYDNVATAEGGENIVNAAVDTFGRLDIVVNNAGILRDKSFLKMTPENWQAVMDVHLNGAYFVTRPAMAAMKENGYGRIVMTTSAAGLYGNFGQTNYSAAKMGLVGLANALKLEGAKYNIKINTVAPIAASRLTEDVMPPDLFEKSSPDFVVPMVLYLCSEACQGSGDIFNAGLGYFNRAAVLTGPAVQLGDPDNPPSVEQVHRHWKQIDSLDGARPLEDATTAIFDLLSPPSAGSAAGGETDAVGDVGAIFEAMKSAFRAEAAAGVDVVFQFDIGGPGGGDWFCEVSDGNCVIEIGTHTKPACTVKMEAADFTALMQGQLPAMQAYTSGKLKLEGDIMKSQLLEKLFKIG
jgi:NAD(P)-dependent dehydrogenase (short-subunit alcohol dehydrogenase family)/putative sterol carrier protein